MRPCPPASPFERFERAAALALSAHFTAARNEGPLTVQVTCVWANDNGLVVRGVVFGADGEPRQGATAELAMILGGLTRHHPEH